MSIWTILDMAASAAPQRCAISWGEYAIGYAELRQRAAQFGARLRASGAAQVVYVGTNHPAFAISLFGATCAGVPIMPLNYRLGDAQLHSALEGAEGAFIVADASCAQRLQVWGLQCASADQLANVPIESGNVESCGGDGSDDGVAVLLQTSGTSSAPKSAVLRHSHLTSYIFGNLDFGSAEPDEAALVSVPPYHIAGVTNLLSNTYATRTLVYLDNFTAAEWLRTTRAKRVTHAMLVPTMLARIVEELKPVGAGDAGLGSLRALSYGGAAISRGVLEQALRLLPQVGFVNAYGLTETSSTIALLGPEDHRSALDNQDARVRARLVSVGKPLDGIEVEIRDESGTVLPVGTSGTLWVRGPQVSGEYRGRPPALDADGWFHTRDRARLDGGGYLFIEGREDDTIIRGGENVAPAEVEDVLCGHPGVLEAAVAGVPDPEWGQRIVAAVVARPGHNLDAEALRGYVRGILRSSRTPDSLEVWEELPYTATGKLLRRQVAEVFTRAQRAEPAQGGS